MREWLKVSNGRKIAEQFLGMGGLTSFSTPKGAGWRGPVDGQLWKGPSDDHIGQEAWLAAADLPRVLGVELTRTDPGTYQGTARNYQAVLNAVRVLRAWGGRYAMYLKQDAQPGLRTWTFFRGRSWPFVVLKVTPKVSQIPVFLELYKPGSDASADSSELMKQNALRA
jgi:hypothetical protein